MAVSKQNSSVKSGKKVSAPAKTITRSAVSASDQTKSASKPVSTTVSASKTIQSPKRVVMTSSEIEAAAKHADVDVTDSVKKTDAAVVKEPVSAASPEPASHKAEATETKPSDTKALEPESEPAKASASGSSVAEKPASRATAKSASSPAAAQKKAAVVTPSAPSSSSEIEKASTVSTKSKTATSPKAAAPVAAKPATAPKKVAAVPAAQSTKPAKTTAEPKPKSKPVAKAAAKPAAKPVPKTVAPEVVKATAPAPKASPAPASAPKLVAKEAAEPLAAKSDNVFGFGAMFMDPNAMEPYLQLWKTPEIDAMVSASQDALEESVSVANEAFTKLFETMTGQSDVFSGAGSRVVAQCEELLDTQQKSFEEVWQASMALFEKTGGIGTELATWMQREIEASQADIDALTKVESLSDIQELQTRILSRCYESSVAEGEKVQEIMMSVMADSFNAMTKAANTVTK